MPPESSPESEVTRVAVAFAEALTRGDWAGAHEMLALSLRDELQAADLNREFQEMTSYWVGPPTELKLGLADSERAYVAIYGESGSVQEAVDVRVIREDGRWLIDDIVWGRP